jgi:hypothetical protein
MLIGTKNESVLESEGILSNTAADQLDEEYEHATSQCAAATNPADLELSGECFSIIST